MSMYFKSARISHVHQVLRVDIDIQRFDCTSTLIGAESFACVGLPKIDDGAGVSGEEKVAVIVEFDLSLIHI